MSFPFRFFFRCWVIVPIGALIFLGWSDYKRLQRVQRVTALPEWSVNVPTIDPHSPTGYAGGRRQLIVPEHNNDSYQWIAQTQQMFAAGQWRVRRVDYDNAPLGRETRLPSLYRWFLGGAAWVDHAVSGRPIGLAVEHAALWLDPALQAAFLVGTTGVVAWEFGFFAAALAALGIATLFPFGGGFIPGAPDHRGLVQIVAFWSVLPLAIGIRRFHAASAPAGRTTRIEPSKKPERAARAWILVAGLMGGVGLWLQTEVEVIVLAGLTLGALVVALLARKCGPSTADAPPWRLWALGGCLPSLAAYMLESFPAHMHFRLDANHPLFAIGWLGIGELLARAPRWFELQRPRFARADLVAVVVASAMLAAAPIAIIGFGVHGPFTDDPLASRLTALNGGVMADNLAKWLARDGLTRAAAATCLPTLILAPALWLLTRRATGLAGRSALAVTLGPALLAAVAACAQLRWWNTLDAALLGVLVITARALVERPQRASTWWLAGAATVTALCGALQLTPRFTTEGGEIVLTESEAQAMVERDFSHWLALHAGPAGATVLAPPDLTTSLYFHGGLRGLGTLSPENKEGLGAAVRIASATSPDEGLELIQRRGVTHVVIPSWDSFLDDYARMGSSAPEGSFVAVLHRWALPPWIRPIPYVVPKIAGLETQSLVVFEVVDEQDDATATIRMAEYLIETGRVDLAAALRPNLRRYPSVLAASVALAEIEFARGDLAAFAPAFEAILPIVAAGGDRLLPWERRVSLAIVLAQGKQIELAKGQIRRCLDQITSGRIRSLTTGALFRFQVLCKAAGMEISDPHMRRLAQTLLPPDLRKRIL